jgi:hypothetical protein
VIISLLLNGAAVVLAAFAASLLTLFLASRHIERHYVPLLRQAVDKALERLGDVVEERVRKGVVEGITSIPSPDLVRKTREAVTDAAGDLVRGGIGALLGDGPPKDKSSK